MKYKFCNLLANLKNGQLARKKIINHSRTKQCEALLNVLWDEGFIQGYRRMKNSSHKLEIFLKYKSKIPAINSIKLVSKPNLKKYYSSRQLWKFETTKGLLIISTNQGLLSSAQCKKFGIGGEPIVIIK